MTEGRERLMAALRNVIDDCAPADNGPESDILVSRGVIDEAAAVLVRELGLLDDANGTGPLGRLLKREERAHQVLDELGVSRKGALGTILSVAGRIKSYCTSWRHFHEVRGERDRLWTENRQLKQENRRLREEMQRAGNYCARATACGEVIRRALAGGGS